MGCCRNVNLIGHTATVRAAHAIQAPIRIFFLTQLKNPDDIRFQSCGCMFVNLFVRLPSGLKIGLQCRTNLRSARDSKILGRTGTQGGGEELEEFTCPESSTGLPDRHFEFLIHIDRSCGSQTGKHDGMSR